MTRVQLAVGPHDVCDREHAEPSDKPGTIWPDQRRRSTRYGQIGRWRRVGGALAVCPVRRETGPQVIGGPKGFADQQGCKRVR